MFKKIIIRYLGVMTGALLLVGNQPVHAQATSPLAITSTVQLDKVTNVDGKPVHTLVDIDKTREKVPGAHLVYKRVYQNVGKVTLSHIVVKDALSTYEMLADDGFGSFDVSVDNGKTYGKLAQLTVSDGKGGSRPALASDVTNLSWTIPALAAGESATLEFHSVIR